MINGEYHYGFLKCWAVRISNNGEFIHAGFETIPAQHITQVSHGRIRLPTTNADARLHHARYGHAVENTDVASHAAGDGGQNRTIPGSRRPATPARQ